MRSAAFGLFLGLVFGACTTQTSQVRPSPSNDNSYGSGLPSIDPSAEKVPAAKQHGLETGDFVITLKDSDGNRPADIPLDVDGQSQLTNSAGQIKVTRPPGRYRFAVKSGCAEKVKVHSGGSGTAHIAAGQTGQGTIAVAWEHRVGPGQATFASMGPWHTNEPEAVLFDMVDRCSDDKAANAPYPTFKFETNANLVLFRPPVNKTDGSGQGKVEVVCKSPGSVQLVIVDSSRPSDRADLIANIPGVGPSGNGPKCQSR